MVKSQADAEHRYRSLFKQYLEHQDEGTLLNFNELGISMTKAGIAPEVAVETHALALESLAPSFPSPIEHDTSQLLPLMEVIMAYGIAFRQQLDAQRDASEAQFFQVLERSRDLIFITDPSGVVSYANPAYQQAMCKYTAERTKTCPQFVDYADCRSPQELWETLRHGETFKGALAVLDEGSRTQIWSVSAFPIDQPQNRLPKFVFMAEDIGAQLALSKRLRRSERLATLGEMASGISHEFNNILLIISGFAELIRDEPDQQSSADFSAEILKAVEKGRNLNEQILSFSKDSEAKCKPMRLETLIARIRELVNSAVGSSIELTFDYPADLIVTLDEDHLCQLLTNLCINAKHAIQSKGLPLHSRITCAFRSVDGLLLLSVTDNGIGMDPALVGSIFEPFFTTKRTGEGSGLGLAIVLKIVDDYHGQIDVVSKLGQGTEFKLKLPVLYGQSPQPLTL